MATWDNETNCWLPKPGVAARYTLEFDGQGRFLMRLVADDGTSPAGAFAGGSVGELCRRLAASVPGGSVVFDGSECPRDIHASCHRWRDVVAVLNGKGTPRRAAVRESYHVRLTWATKYVRRAGYEFAPTPLGLAADAKLDAADAAAAAKPTGGDS